MSTFVICCHLSLYTRNNSHWKGGQPIYLLCFNFLPGTWGQQTVVALRCPSLFLCLKGGNRIWSYVLHCNRERIENVCCKGSKKSTNKINSMLQKGLKGELGRGGGSWLKVFEFLDLIILYFQCQLKTFRPFLLYDILLSLQGRDHLSFNMSATLCALSPWSNMALLDVSITSNHNNNNYHKTKL